MTISGHRIQRIAALSLCAMLLTGLFVLPSGETNAQGPEGWIVGQVTDPDTNPVKAYMLLMFSMGSGNPTGGGWTDDNGYFNFTVLGGMDYIVMAANGSFYFNAGMASVGVGEEVTVNIVMTPIAPVVADVTIVGFVTDSDGNPVTGGSIIGYVNDPANMGQGMPIYANLTVPDPSGYFSLNVIPGDVGGGVATFDTPGYPATDNTTLDPFVSGQTYWLNLTLAAEVSTDDAVLSGHVYDFSTGLPINGAMVRYQGRNQWMPENSGYENYTFTDATGYYEMNVTNGSGEILFMKDGYSMYMYDGQQVNPSDVLTYDAWLLATTAVLSGNVTDAKSGLPVASARVYVTDGLGNISMGTTDGSGAYSFDVFDGLGLFVVAEADGYARDMAPIDILPGDSLWMDFEIRPVDANMSGTVVDLYSSAPIPFASLHIYNSYYDEWANADGVGAYFFKQLVSGDYTLEAWAMDYRQYSEAVTVVPGGNVWDVEMTPWDVPNTCKLYGWVNDSDSGTPLSAARMRIGISPDDRSEHNSSYTDSSGYYEMWIPAMSLLWVANASDHQHASGSLDATGMTEIELSVALTPDLWMPNLTRWDDVPSENISTVIPLVTDIEFDEADPSTIMLWKFVYWQDVGGGWDQYYMVRAQGASFDPLEGGSNDLPYSLVGEHFTINDVWSAQVTGGWLTDGLTSVYLPSWEYTMGMTTYEVIRGQYWNFSQPMPQSCSAFFDKATGDLIIVMLDMGMQPVDLGDASGMFTAESNALQVQRQGAGWNWVGSTQLGTWMITGLKFNYEPTVPSARYVDLFGVMDWANHGWWGVKKLTVDTDPPVAEAGPDQSAIVNTEVTLDGSSSTDNVGIVNYTWEYTDSMGTHQAYGPVATVTFTETASFVVTLTVTDAGGNQATDWLLVTVDVDQPPIANAGPDQDVAVLQLVHFDGSGSTDDVGIVNFTWTIVELSVNLWGPTPEYTFTVAGLYTLELVVTDTADQSGMDLMLVTVNPDTISPVANAGPDQTVMAGEFVYFDGSGSTDNVGIVNWTWTFTWNSTTVTLYGENVSYIFDSEPATVIVTLTVYDQAGNSDSDTVTLDISGMIPEFPLLVLPVIGMLGVIVVLGRRRR